MTTRPLDAGSHDGASDRQHPSWLRIARALLVGFALGLVVHVMASLLLAQLDARGPSGANGTAVQCEKRSPARQPAAARPPASVIAS
jgi:hypothetical protein